MPIIGAIDLVEQDECRHNNHHGLQDMLASLFNADEIDQNPQMTIYQMAAKANGFADREILLKFDCLIKTKTPKFEQYCTTRSEIDETAPDHGRFKEYGRASARQCSSRMTPSGNARGVTSESLR